MPDPSVASLKQIAVLWDVVGYDRHGQPRLTDTPVEVKVRWDDSRSEAQDKDSNTISVDAKVLTTRRVVNGSLMWLGRLSEFPGDTKDPTVYDGSRGPLMTVKSYNGTPDIKAHFVTHGLGLSRYRDQLPPSGAQ